MSDSKFSDFIKFFIYLYFPSRTLKVWHTSVSEGKINVERRVHLELQFIIKKSLLRFLEFYLDLEI